MHRALMKAARSILVAASATSRLEDRLKVDCYLLWSLHLESIRTAYRKEQNDDKYERLRGPDRRYTQ